MNRVTVEWQTNGDEVCGTAYERGTGAPICAVVATLGYFDVEGVDDLIDRYLSPALDAKLTELVGPLAFKTVEGR
jgi:hypothetical protein